MIYAHSHSTFIVGCMFYEQQFPQMQLQLYGCLLCVFLHMYVRQRVSNEQIKSQRDRGKDEGGETERVQCMQEEKERRGEKVISLRFGVSA